MGSATGLDYHVSSIPSWLAKIAGVELDKITRQPLSENERDPSHGVGDAAPRRQPRRQGQKAAPNSCPGPVAESHHPHSCPNLKHRQHLSSASAAAPRLKSVVVGPSLAWSSLLRLHCTAAYHSVESSLLGLVGWVVRWRSPSRFLAVCLCRGIHW
jgi:hypothetical protein